jgi:hypothetical protein
MKLILFALFALLIVIIVYGVIDTRDGFYEIPISESESSYITKEKKTAPAVIRCFSRE